MDKQKKIAINIVVLFFIFIGIFLRFHNIASPSIWVDELNHYYAAKSINEIGKPIFPSGFPNIRAEIYSRFVALSFKVLGENEFSLRLPSALFGVFCIVLVYFISLRFFDRRTAVLSVLFISISPFAIGWSRLSRMYTLFQLLFGIGSYMFYLGFESKNTGVLHNLQSKVLDKFRMDAIRAILERQNINLVWLLLSLVPFYFSYRIHDITTIFGIGFLFYLLFMSVVKWRKEDIKSAIKSKYFVVFVSSMVLGLLAFILSAKLRAFIDYAIYYYPKWADGTRFKDRKLYLDFIFNDMHFPVGVLFVIGIYQIFARMHRTGIYIASLFFGYFFMFTFVFSYRHFQYLYNVYSFFIIIAAFSYANIINYEYDAIKQNWFFKQKWKPILIEGLVFFLFLTWIPFTPSVRLSRRIPFIKDGGYNGAMYMEEWREACNYVKDKVQVQDIVISTDALGTWHYLGRIDYDLNGADLEIAEKKHFVNAQNEYCDIYSGAKLIVNLNNLKRIISNHQRIWLLAQHYKLFEALSYVPADERKCILENFKLIKSTTRKTVDIFYLTKNVE